MLVDDGNDDGGGEFGEEEEEHGDQHCFFSVVEDHAGRRSWALEGRPCPCNRRM